ncbi:MAG: IclR family transcriptional regulator [Spirochaetales bacterium]|nr:MAG: IclR family transcriptional regulator [Spirochaetales bacterium]
MEKTETGNAKTISAVARAFIIVEKLALVSSSNLEELAHATGLAKPTVYRFLITLRELGYVKKDDTDRWFLTMRLFTIGSKALDHIELTAVARPIARALSADLGETVHMGILDENEGLYILKIESRFTIRMYSRVGKKIPLYCTAIGKTLLADMDDSARAKAISAIKLVPFTPNTIRDVTALEIELEKIRAEGIATDNEEHESGVTCQAAPIYDHSGRVVAALSVSWPVFRFDVTRRDEYAKKIQEAASEISAVLGDAVL